MTQDEAQTLATYGQALDRAQALYTALVDLPAPPLDQARTRGVEVSRANVRYRQALHAYNDYAAQVAPAEARPEL